MTIIKFGVLPDDESRIRSANAPNDDTLFPLPGCDNLGSGYNVLNGYYADSKSCTHQLFDIPQDLENVQVGSRVFQKPKILTYLSSHETDMYISSGQSIQEYSQSVNTSIKVEGNYSFFSSSVETDFGESSAKSLQNAFSRINYRVDEYTLQLPPTPNELLKADVKALIDQGDITTLFDTYGTHYLAGLVMGGTAVYSSVTNKSKYNSTTELSVSAEMSYKTIIGSITADEKTKYATAISTFDESSTTSLVTKGGNPAYGGADFPEHTDDWSGSVVDYLAFVDFLNDKSLVGIWELASTAARKQEIEDYYPTYCELNEKKFNLVEPVLRARIVPLTKQQFSDEGSHAHSDFSVCIPDFGDDWYYLGQCAFPGGGPSGYSLVVKEIYPGSGVLADIDHWEHVWDDSGSHRDLDYSLWRGVAYDPYEYQVVTDFFRGQVDHEFPPTPTEAAGIKAVHTSFLVPGKIGDLVWNDAGTRATNDASVWKILAADSTAIDMSKLEPYYVSGQSQYDKPDRPVYVLKKSAVLFDS